MLTTYFKHTFTLNKLRSGPAGPHLDEFACRFIREGYSYLTVRRHLRHYIMSSSQSSTAAWRRL